MKKTSGILRNKFGVYTDVKLKIQRKKTRFQIVGKDSEDLSQRQQRISQQLLTQTSVNQTGQQKYLSSQIYEKATQKLGSIKGIQKQITVQSKARLTSFKESENAKYDANIAKMASDATNILVQAEKNLKEFRQFEPANKAQAKFIKNMEYSLAQQIRQISRSLRQQQKQYFDRIRMYEKGTTNTAIQLSPQEKRSMKNFMQDEMVQQQMDTRNQSIQQLVKSINKLSGIYKELNTLVIEQGSLIDRIDVNIEQTYEHTQKAVVHLEGANEHASSGFADKVIKVLVVMIIMIALMLGFKYMN